MMPVDTYFVDEGTMHGESRSRRVCILIVYKIGRKGTLSMQETNVCY